MQAAVDSVAARGTVTVAGTYDESVTITKVLTLTGRRGAVINASGHSYGALVHPEHYARVLDYVEIGKKEARLLAGGVRPSHLAGGNHLQPAVFADVPRDARIFQEEIFGPVVAVALRRRRSGRSRERHSVRPRGVHLDRDVKRGHRIAHAVESGMIWIDY